MGPVEILVILLVMVLVVAGIYAALNALRRR
jgi:hypothetical protein